MRFQNPHLASNYRSTIHAFLTIVREERIRGLYRGIAAPLVRPNPPADASLDTLTLAAQIHIRQYI